MSNALTRRLDAKFALFDELAEALPDERFGAHLATARSNTIADQLWCVIGTRESYTRAVTAGEWGGWACSLGALEPAAVRAALKTSGEAARAAVAADLDEPREELALALLEHEAQHLGQLLRFLLALELEVPPGWREYFAL